MSGDVFVLGVRILPFSTIFLLDFGCVPTVSYFFSFRERGRFILLHYGNESCTFTSNSIEIQTGKTWK